jgi:hypothetical protein
MIVLKQRRLADAVAAENGQEFAVPTLIDRSWSTGVLP